MLKAGQCVAFTLPTAEQLQLTPKASSILNRGLLVTCACKCALDTDAVVVFYSGLNYFNSTAIF